jgi:hypothetical protein
LGDINTALTGKTMADPWELILHHTYAGTPGVIFDESPSRGSHGVAVNLADSDFRTDGMSIGSGAVIFHPGSSIRVAASTSWSQLSGLRGEVVCARESSVAENTLIDGGSFRFYTRGPHFFARFSADPNQNTQIDTHLNPVVPNFQLPSGRWITLGFVYDGASTMELYLDGTTVARVQRPLWPVNAANNLSIGNSQLASSAMEGLIDDVKVWRPDPHRVDEQFIGRLVDHDVAHCWAEWGREMREVLRNNPACAATLADLVSRAAASLVRDGFNHGDETRQRWQKTVETYAELWSDGDLGAIVPVMADLVSWLQLAGLDPRQNADVIALIN